MIKFGLPAKHTPKLAVIIDVGSFALKIITVEISDHSWQILNKRKIFLPPFTYDETDRVWSSVHRLLRENIFRIIKELGKMPSVLVLGIGRPWVELAIENQVIHRPASKKFISQEEIKTLFESILKDKQDYLAQNNLRLTNSFPLRVTINGYEIKNFSTGILGEEIGFKSLYMYTPVERQNEFLSLAKIFGGIDVKILSTALALAKAAARVLAVDEAFFWDIGGAASEGFTLRDGILDEIFFMPRGGNIFLKRLSQEFNINDRASLALLRQYADGLITQEEKLRIHQLANDEASAWERGLKKSLEPLKRTELFPTSLYITGGGAQIPEIVRVAESKEWLSGFWARGDLIFSTLTAENLLPRPPLGEFLEGTGEAGLSALLSEEIFANTIKYP